MKLSLSSSKPGLSPGRPAAGWFTPPLMRFLRGNVSSRARPRSRSMATPLFFRKKRTTTSSSSAAATQEPSSPKVTCIGQVRVHHSKSSSSQKKKTRFSYFHRHCCFFQNPCSCNRDSIKLKVFQPILRFWVRVFSCGSDNLRPNSAQNGSISDGFEQEDEDIEERESGIEASASTPPKNALLLTRCRSAPYTCRLLGSPLRTEEERETGVQKTEQETTETPASDTESCRAGRGLVVKSRGDCEGGNSGEEGQGNRATIDEGLKERPPLMMLMRCRSEPTRRGCEKLDPLTSKFWAERRLELLAQRLPKDLPHAPSWSIFCGCNIHEMFT